MTAVSLLYHDVVDGDLDSSGLSGPGADNYKLELPKFREHLSALQQSTAPPRLRVTELEVSGSDARNPVFLTFDDGGISAHSIVADLLEDRNWIGHFFVTAGRIGTRAFMNVAQLRDLDARGHVIGSHSWSHPLRISALGPHAILAEWQRSTDRLADILGKPILTGSVPGGFYSREVVRAAEQAGIRFLFTSEPVIQPRLIGSSLALGRFSITRSTPADQALALANGTGWTRHRQWASWNLRKGMKVVGGPLYHRFREKVLRWQLRT